MSEMSRLYTDIQLLLEEGKSIETVARLLDVPNSWVEGVLKDMLDLPQDSYDCFDTVNS